jgi:hypothetical protein
LQTASRNQARWNTRFKNQELQGLYIIKDLQTCWFTKEIDIEHLRPFSNVSWLSLVSRSFKNQELQGLGCD